MNAILIIVKRFCEKVLERLTKKSRKIKELEEEVETLRYLVNTAIDITEFPKAEGVLRLVQQADTEMIRIFHEVCEKNNLIYWLDYGTLLGAVRHKGFIPWDDDVDVAMPREDYHKIQNVLSEEMKKYNIDVLVKDECRIAICDWKAGMIMDIFPMDTERVKCSYTELKNKLNLCRRYYKKNRNKQTSEMLTKKMREIINGGEGDKVWYHNVEFAADETVFDDKTIFPLKKIEFEDYYFWVPKDCDKYLAEIYGDYMKFPRNGILKHNAQNNKIYENPIKKGINMEDRIKQLRKIEL